MFASHGDEIDEINLSTLSEMPFFNSMTRPCILVKPARTCEIRYVQDSFAKGGAQPHLEVYTKW